MKDKDRNEIGEALSEATYAYAKMNGKTTCFKTIEWDIAKEIWKIEDAANKIIQSDGELFSVKESKYEKRKVVHATKLGNLILRRFNTSILEISNHFPMHQFNPYFELFVKKGESRNIYNLLPLLKTFSRHEIEAMVDTLNGFVEEVRNEGRSKKFKDTMAEFKRLANKNYRSLLRYIDALFVHYSRLLVLRIDLGYHKNHCWPSSAEGLVTYVDAKKHWPAMYKYLRTMLPNDCFVGFSMKLEYALQKNFHFHLLVFLDGSKVREDITISKLIGERWENVITEGKGLYWNCNANKRAYKALGIGMVNHYDAELRENLKAKVATYMTKTDYYIKLVIPNNGRAFSKGNMPKSKSIKLGRPRKKVQMKFGNGK